MSLVLNGGVGGALSTQYAYIDNRIVSALPATVTFWFKNGIDSNAGGQFAQWVDADATLGTYRMGGGSSRSTGIVFTRTVGSRVSTSSYSSVASLTATDVTSIATGATTAVTVADASTFSAGEYVRLEGTFTGITGITSGREWRISSIESNTLTLALASSGSWGEAQTATVKWSAWQPEKWNFGMLSFANVGGDANNQLKGGFLGNTSVSIAAEFPGLAGQRPNDIFSVLDRFCIGAYLQSGTATGHVRGELAHVAVWGVRPTDGETAELLIKAPPLVSWGTPLAYTSFLVDANDEIGSNHYTLVGSPTINADGPSITLTGGGGGGAGYIPHLMQTRSVFPFGLR